MIGLQFATAQLTFVIASYGCAHLYESTIDYRSNQLKSMLSRQSLKY